MRRGDGMRIEVAHGSQADRWLKEYKKGIKLAFLDADGFEATLFRLETGGFSSDYIHLVDGENQIIIQVQDSMGKVTSAELTISHHSKL